MDVPKVVEEKDRYVEIYKIICIISNKSYIGQAVSHILNRGKFKRYGMKGRFNSHVSEAFSTKKNQCHYLNASIRKYGKNNFKLELLGKCSLDEADRVEGEYIIRENTMFPNGYNLKLGTATTRLSEEGRKRVSRGVQKYYEEAKIKRFENVKIDENNLEQYIKVLKRDGEHFGYYVYANKTKADFGGIHIPVNVSYQLALEFLNELVRIQRETLLREKP